MLEVGRSNYDMLGVCYLFIYLFWRGIIKVLGIVRVIV